MAAQMVASLIFVHPTPCFSEYFCERLRDAGFARVAQAYSPAEGLNLIDRMQPNLALVGSNLNAYAGFRDCQLLHQYVPTLKLILFSVHSAELTAQADAYAVGALACVHPNQPFSAFLPIIADVLANKVLIPPIALQPVLEPTEKECAIIRCWVEDLEITEKEIAQRLHLSSHTIHSHVQHIYQKRGTTKKREILLRALRRGWV
jgi:DNA-binding NarL/FixJ family response regulator